MQKMSILQVDRRRHTIRLFGPVHSHIQRGNLGSHSRDPKAFARVRDGMLPQATGHHQMWPRIRNVYMNAALKWMLFRKSGNGV